MKKILIAVCAATACCFAATPYTGLMKNLNIATFGVEDYSKVKNISVENIPEAVDFAKNFRTSLQNHISKKYPATTFKKGYSNSKSSDVKIGTFKEKLKEDNNIVMFVGHGLDTKNVSTGKYTHQKVLMYDGSLDVENMTFSSSTYFAFFHACNFLSFYTDTKGRDKYGFYIKKSNGVKSTVWTPNENYSDGDDDGWTDAEEAKPQEKAYTSFVNAFANGLHAMFGFSSLSITWRTSTNGKDDYADPSLYETFAKKWIDDGLRIWQAYKYAVWKEMYKGMSFGVEPAVIYKSGTAIKNDGKSTSFKGYCEFYKTIYQYPMVKGSLGRKKAVYGYPQY